MIEYQTIVLNERITIIEGKEVIGFEKPDELVVKGHVRICGGRAFTSRFTGLIDINGKERYASSNNLMITAIFPNDHSIGRFEECLNSRHYSIRGKRIKSIDEMAARKS